MTVPFDAFGPGVIVVTRTDVANSTPVNIGYANSFNLQFQGNIKELFGQNQMPLDAARGTIKITGKATAAVLSGIAWNNVFFGDSFTSGGIQWNYQEKKTVTSGSVAALTNAGTFDADLGVTYFSSGLPLIKVASAPAVGQYTQTGATYAMNSSDTGPVLVSYTSTVTTGQTLSIVNQLLGYAPNFQLDYYTMRNNKALVVRLYQAQSASINLPVKLEDFIMPELEMHFFANASGQIGNIYFPEVS